MNQIITLCISVSRHDDLTEPHWGLPVYLASRERERGGEQEIDREVCVCVHVCLVRGWIAERVTAAYEQVSDSEKHQIREQVLTQPVAIDPGSTGLPKHH